MKRYVRVNIRDIITKVSDEFDDFSLITYDDEIVVWTVSGQKCSLNYKRMDPEEIEREMFDQSEEAELDADQDTVYSSHAIKASQEAEYSLEVVPEGNDEDDNPCCWAMKFHDEDGQQHFVWITKYGSKEFVVEDSNGNNLVRSGNNETVYKTFSGAKRAAEQIARKQQMKDRYSN